MAELCGDAVVMGLIGLVIGLTIRYFTKKHPHGYLNRNKDYPEDKDK